MKFPFPFRKRLKEPDIEKEQELRQTIINEGGVSNKDVLAMILGAYSAIIPAVLVIFAILALFIWLVFF